MKKTITITLAGLVFHIEEAAYERLQSYLTAIKKYFSTYEGADEITQDIEVRIAEKFFDKLKKENKQAVEITDVDELIKSMGTVSDFQSADQEEPTPTPQATEKQPIVERILQKSFYRDTKRKVLGGVCAGIAHQYGFDPLWVRLGFLFLFIGMPIFGGISNLGEFFGPLTGILFIIYIACWVAFPGKNNLDEDEKLHKFFRNPERKALGGVAAGIAAYTGWDLGLIRFVWVISAFLGVGLILYFIVWAITPAARSLTDKMRMQGEPITLTNIETNVKRALDPDGQGKESAITEIVLIPFRLVATLFDSLGPLMKFLGKSIGVITGFFVAFGASMGIIGLVAALGIFLGITSAFGIIKKTGMIGGLDIPGSLLIFGFLALVMPLVFLGFAGVSLIMRKSLFDGLVWQTLLGLLLIGILGTAVMLPRYLMNFSEGASVTRTTTLPNVYDFDTESNRHSPFGRHYSLELVGYDGSALLLDAKLFSQGSSREEAQKNAEAIQYNVVQEDSSLIFLGDFSLAKGAPFRGQDASFTLRIPYEKPFKITRRFAAFVTNPFPWQLYDNGQIEGSIWKFTQSGELVCINREMPDNQSGDSYVPNDNYEENIGVGTPHDLNIQNFKHLNIGNDFSVEVRQGNNYKVTVFTENEEDFNNIDVNTNNNTLIIKRKARFFNNGENRNASIRIEMPSLEKVNFSGAVGVTIKGFADIEEIELSGASRVVFFGINDTDGLATDQAGASQLTLLGKAEKISVNVSGSSEIIAENFTVQTAAVDASGAASAKLNIAKNLTAIASGSSSVTYKGGGTTQSQTSGNGSITAVVEE